jgi:hypothetical protein
MRPRNGIAAKLAKPVRNHVGRRAQRVIDIAGNTIVGRCTELTQVERTDYYAATSEFELHCSGLDALIAGKPSPGRLRDADAAFEVVMSRAKRLSRALEPLVTLDDSIALQRKSVDRARGELVARYRRSRDRALNLPPASNTGRRPRQPIHDWLIDSGPG